MQELELLRANASPFPQLSVAAHAKCIGGAIDVVKPGRDQRNLQNAAIIEADGAQLDVIIRAALRRVFRQFHHIVQHGAILRADWRSPIVALQRIDHRFIQRDATQKLCVGFDSIVTPVSDRDHGRDHFMLTPL